MNHNPLSIFIIDDDSLLCFILKKQIQGFKDLSIWDTATDGEQALEKLKQAAQDEVKGPDIILLDLNMPLMDGWEFLKRYCADGLLKQLHCLLCILSSSINSEDKARSSEYPMVAHYYTKPLLDGDIRHLITLAQGSSK